VVDLERNALLRSSAAHTAVKLTFVSEESESENANDELLNMKLPDSVDDIVVYRRYAFETLT
jgi:hypothetical protein